MLAFGTKLKQVLELVKVFDKRIFYISQLYTMQFIRRADIFSKMRVRFSRFSLFGEKVAGTARKLRAVFASARSADPEIITIYITKDISKYSNRSPHEDGLMVAQEAEMTESAGAGLEQTTYTRCCNTRAWPTLQNYISMRLGDLGEDEGTLPTKMDRATRLTLITRSWPRCPTSGGLVRS